MTQTATRTHLMTQTPDARPQAVRREPAGLFLRLAMDTLYVVSGFPLAILGFVLVVVGLSLGAGLLVLGVGLAVWVAILYLSRGLAHVERLRLRSMQGRVAPLPAYARAADDARPLRRLLTPLRDPQSWLDAIWGLIGFATGVSAFVVVVTWWAGTGGGLTYWFWQRWLPDQDQTLASLIGFGSGQGPESVLNLVFGALGLLTLPWVVHASAATHAGVADVLLSSRARLQSEVRRVTGSRAAARTAEAGSLRRLERDIHDGPQQRLVRLTMDLGRARKQLGEDPERAAGIIEEAMLQARETVDELRSLSRGIAPPLLVDRGLRVAIQELLQRSAVPTGASIEVPDDLPPHIETAAYFVVSEALTNVAKHSGATTAHVALTARDGWLAVVVGDNGIGGAHPAKGLGLAGLQQRLAGVDGTLEVDSPVGGPTHLRALVPLG